jgi:hypothetical protein
MADCGLFPFGMAFDEALGIACDRIGVPLNIDRAVTWLGSSKKEKVMRRHGYDQSPEEEEDGIERRNGEKDREASRQYRESQRRLDAEQDQQGDDQNGETGVNDVYEWAIENLDTGELDALSAMFRTYVNRAAERSEPEEDCPPPPSAKDRRKTARDNPPPFPGRPNPGGKLDPLTGERDKLAGDSMTSPAFPPGAYLVGQCPDYRPLTLPEQMRLQERIQKRRALMANDGRRAFARGAQGAEDSKAAVDFYARYPDARRIGHAARGAAAGLARFPARRELRPRLAVRRRIYAATPEKAARKNISGRAG